jgi:hypothetical protein
MKTTLESPDNLFRRAKSAAERGIPLKEFVTEVVKDNLVAATKTTEKPWMAAFGKLRHLRKETSRINRSLRRSSSRSRQRTGCDLGHEWSLGAGRG